MSYEYYVENGEGEMYSVRYEHRIAVDFYNEGVSMTRQEYSDECDVNQIMDRYEKAGGQWPPPPNVAAEPKYFDFRTVPSDLQQSMNLMIDADSAFMKLSASVRKEFDNNALAFVEYASAEENLPQMRKWGLAEPEKTPDAPVRVEVVSPPLAPAVAPATG